MFQTFNRGPKQPKKKKTAQVDSKQFDPFASDDSLKSESPKSKPTNQEENPSGLGDLMHVISDKCTDVNQFMNNMDKLVQ